MNKSAKTGDREDPMAAPEVCSKNWSLHLKQDDETQVRSSSWSCSGVRLVRSVMSGSTWRRSLAMRHASLVGMLVKRETTSN